MGMIEKMSKRKILKTEIFELDKDFPLSFMCDDIVLIPVKSKTCMFYKNIDAVICVDGEPVYRLKGGGDVVFVEPSTRSIKIDILSKSKLHRLFPTYGRFIINWDGIDLHIKRLPNDDEIV